MGKNVENFPHIKGQISAAPLTCPRKVRQIAGTLPWPALLFEKGKPMYRTFALLLPESDFTLDKVAQKILTAFPGSQASRADQQIQVTTPDWEVHLTLEEGPEVLEETQRIAEHIGGNEDELGIRRCARRVVIASDVPDPMMEHFADYLKVIDVLRTFKGLILVDPQEPSLL